MESDRSKEMLLSMVISTRILRCRSMISLSLSLSLWLTCLERDDHYGNFNKYYQLNERMNVQI